MRYKCLMSDAGSKLPLIDLAAQRRRLDGRIEAAIARVMAHGQFIMGPEVTALEQALADRVGVRHVISCANGTDALLLALMARGIGPGDAVFVPAFTFAAPAEAVALAGATPVLVDVGADFTVDPASLAAAIEAIGAEGALEPRAVVPVDLFGQPARYERILPIARARRLFVLQDAAQSLGARWQGQPAGRQGDAAATSFYPSKPLGCYGDGGAVLTDDDDLAARIRSLARHGTGSDGRHQRIGLNSRLDTLQAAILLAKLPSLESERRPGRRSRNVTPWPSKAWSPCRAQEKASSPPGPTTRCWRRSATRSPRLSPRATSRARSTTGAPCTTNPPMPNSPGRLTCGLRRNMRMRRSACRCTPICSPPTRRESSRRFLRRWAKKGLIPNGRRPTYHQLPGRNT